MRDDRVVYTFPTTPAPQLALTLRNHYNRIKPVTATRLKVEPTTPTDAFSYTLLLQAGEAPVIRNLSPASRQRRSVPLYP
ncbi:hypothetical protein [Granulicella aggregans]|uniref:hypothetical protein n=1 Tax=Granulicella aggregans TaxID=474949 RepID=UPI0021DF9007|nr:hypothetical protein [Granulicella aggregans]